MTAVKRLTQITLTTTPAAQIQIMGGPQGNGTLTAPVVDGATYVIRVATSHKKAATSQTRQGRKTYPVYSTWVPGGWRTGGVGPGEHDAARGGWKCAGETDTHQVRGPNGGGYRNVWFNNDGKPAFFDATGVCWQFYTETLNNWTGGVTVLKAAGTGNFTKITQSINLQSAVFAADAEWSEGPPPSSLGHNNC